MDDPENFNDWVPDYLILPSPRHVLTAQERFKGGTARQALMTDHERTALARKAAFVRWGKKVLGKRR